MGAFRLGQQRIAEVGLRHGPGLRHVGSGVDFERFSSQLLRIYGPEAVRPEAGWGEEDENQLPVAEPSLGQGHQDGQSEGWRCPFSLWMSRSIAVCPAS